MNKLERCGLGFLMVVSGDVLLKVSQSDLTPGLMGSMAMLIGMVIMLRAAFQK
jgi:hypothetical protein